MNLSSVAAAELVGTDPEPSEARVHLPAFVQLPSENLDLLFSDRGIVFGASYTDIKAQLPVLRILIWVSALYAIPVLVSAFRGTYRLPPGELQPWLPLA